MMLNDVRQGLRLILRRPLFAALAIITLAVGIGATTTMFALADRILLRAVPFPEAERLVIVWETNPSLPVPVMLASAPTLHDWQTRNRSFESIGGYRWRSMTVTGAGEPEQVRGALITASLQRVLAMQPQLGRFFTESEDKPDAPPVVLISDAMWRRRFGGDAAVLGQRVSLDGRSHEIIGVMPPEYLAPPPVVLRGLPPSERTEIWVPLAVDLPLGRRNAHNLTVIARLRSGVTVESADLDVKRIAADVANEDPAVRDWDARVVPLRGWVTSAWRRSTAMVAIAVGFILLLSCANVATLLLGRGIGRRRDFAIRAALGASRARLAAQVIAEALGLALAGGVAGAALAAALIHAIATRGPAMVPGIRDASLDGRALALAVGVSLVAAVLAGIVPALRAAGGRVSDRLAERGPGPGHGALRVQRTLVIAQVALAVALLVSATLLVESFRRLRAVDPGFRAEAVVTGQLLLHATRYPDAAARIAFVERFLAGARALPGISAVGISDALPLAGNRQGTAFVRFDAGGASADQGIANFAHVTESYFEALGMRLLAGRTFTDRDTSSRPGVVVINESLARQHFGTETPVGRFARIKAAGDTPFEIVGVVADDRHAGIDAEPTPSFFLPYRHTPGPGEVAVITRAAGDRAALVAALRSSIHAIDPEMPFYRVQTMDDVVHAAMATPRALAWLLSGLSLFGLLLAAIGLFGVLSQGVSQRTAEIGLRMALGATPGQVLRMVLGEGLAQAGIGIVIGLGMAAAMSRLLSGLLFGVTTTDLAPYVIVVMLLISVTLTASLAPGMRAMRVDPATSLRAE